MTTTATKLVAFHNSPSEKDVIIAQLEAHYAADEITKGVYWKNGKGCAVGCTIHSSAHVEYESRFGIPQVLARLEDRIFEGLSNGEAKEFPLRFMRAIPVGTDLSRVGYAFLHRILTDESIMPSINHSSVKDAIAGVAKLFDRAMRDDMPNGNEWQSAKNAAKAAAYAADADAAATDAAYADAAYAATDAAYAAAYAAATDAAYAAAAAAYAAAAAAAAAYAVAAAADAVAAVAAAAAYAAVADRSKAYSQMATALIELLAAA